MFTFISDITVTLVAIAASPLYVTFHCKLSIDFFIALGISIAEE